MKSLKSVATSGVRILVENMPPLPWYFGGQWHNTVFMDPAEIANFAQQMGWEVCYDISHAQLYCNHAGKTLQEFTRTILDHTAYLHISDANGATEEGLQVGKGNVDFEQLFTMIQHVDIAFVPELCQGHLERCRGFVTALKKVEQASRKVAGA